jgi:hypothetical protein
MELCDPGAEVRQLLFDAGCQVGGDRACADLFGGHRWFRPRVAVRCRRFG